MKSGMHALQTISIVLFFAGCGAREEAPIVFRDDHKDEVTLRSDSRKEIGLEVLRVERRPLKGSLALAARVVADQDNEARVGSLVAGRVREVFVKAGDVVAKGTVLMTIEGLDVGEIKAGYLKAKAAFDFAKGAWERQKRLFEEKIGSQKAMLESQAEYEKSLAEFRAEDRRIHSVGLSDEMVISGSADEHTAGTLPIRSPLDGVIAERNVVLGQYVEATTNAFTILNTGTVWVDAQLYEKDIDKISLQSSVSFTAEGRPSQRFHGRIIFIGSVVDERTRTITVRGQFANGGLKLKPQMFGELIVPIGAGVDGLIVPLESVVREAANEYVFVQTSDSTFQRRNITTGSVIENAVEVRQGIQAGESVVSKGVFYLKSELQKEELGGDEH